MSLQDDIRELLIGKVESVNIEDVVDVVELFIRRNFIAKAELPTPKKVATELKQEPYKPRAIVSAPDGVETKPEDARFFGSPVRKADICAEPNE